MKKFTPIPVLPIVLLLASMAGVRSNAFGQNIFSGEPVQVVGQFNSYTTTPYNADYRTTVYRRISITTGTPTDGRGQWATTINIPSGDAMATNMPGGANVGFLFISGPSGNRFLNKWDFNGVGQGALDQVNAMNVFNGGTDMGLNMSATGYYTFVMNDNGYNATNAKFYVGFTSAPPVSINTVSATPNIGGTSTISVTTSASPSAEENIYVSYTTGSDFITSTSLVQVSMAGTSGTATIPAFAVGQTVRYYVFSSTRTLAQLNASSESNRMMATLNYNDNGGTNYFYVALPIELTGFYAVPKAHSVVLSWTTATERNNSHFNIQRSADSRDWENIGVVSGKGTTMELQSYTFTDEKPLGGLNLYRLQQVDLNGDTDYSHILQVEMDKAQTDFTLYPNPVTGDEVYLDFPELNEAALVRLFDLQGRMLREWHFEPEGNARFRLDLAGLPAGNMVVQVNDQAGKLLFR